MDAEDSHDHGGADPGGTDPVSTVAHQDGPPNNVSSLLNKRNLYHVPAGASNEESLCGATVLGATSACAMDTEQGSKSFLVEQILVAQWYIKMVHQSTYVVIRLCRCTCDNQEAASSAFPLQQAFE